MAKIGDTVILTYVGDIVRIKPDYEGDADVTLKLHDGSEYMTQWSELQAHGVVVRANGGDDEDK